MDKEELLEQKIDTISANFESQTLVCRRFFDQIDRRIALVEDHSEKVNGNLDRIKERVFLNSEGIAKIIGMVDGIPNNNILTRKQLGVLSVLIPAVTAIIVALIQVLL